jgi:hypothetical protein
VGLAKEEQPTKSIQQDRWKCTQSLKLAVLALFSRPPEEFLWYLWEIRARLKLNRATARLIHKVPKA